MKISKNGVLTSVDAMDITEDGKLIIPEGVEKIEKGAFDNLFIKSFMFELEIPGSLKKIEDQNFCEMSALETVAMAEGVEEIGNLAFTCCFNLREVNIPSSVKKIGTYAFAECPSLEEISLPELSVIEPRTFLNCSSLKRIDIPASVEYIDREAFKGCDDLKEVNFAENGNLKFLVISAFEDCESLKELDVPPTIDTLFLLGSLEGCRSLETFRLPAPENLLCVNCTMGEKKESDISAFLPENTELVRYKKSAEVGGRNKN